MANAEIRPIELGDDLAIAGVIRQVMPRYGAVGAGFAIHDPEVEAMHAAYSRPRTRYLVVEVDGRVVGGAGIAPLEGGDGSTCELKKMYFLDEARGQGLGRRMLEELLDAARALGFSRIYLETLTGMDDAMKLYRKLGFEKTCRDGATGHFGCDLFFARTL